MKKLLATLLIGACAFTVLPATMVQANAAEKTSVFMQESFDDLKTSKWAVDTASNSMTLYSSEDSHISFDRHAEQFLLGTTEKLVNLDYFQFDYMPVGDKWTPIYFVNDIDLGKNSSNTFPQTSDFYTYEPQIAFYPNSISTFSAKTTVAQKSWSLTQNEWYTMQLKVTSDKTADLYYALRGQDVTAGGVRATVTLSENAGLTFDGLYILLGRGTDAGQGMHVDNVKVKYQTQGADGYEDALIDENFNADEMDERILPINAAAGSGYSVVKAESMLSINAAQTGDSIIYATGVEEETSIISSLECIDAEIGISFKEGKTDSLSFAFGMKDGADYAKGCYAVDMYADGVKLSQISADGVKSNLTEKVATNKLAQSGAIVNITVNKDGTVCVSVDGEKLIEKTIEEANYYVGKLGFVVTDATANTGKVMVDKIVIHTTKYKVPVTKSVTHNFSNDYFGNEGYEDFIMNTNGGRQYVKDGKLVWEGLSDESFFGSAHEYDEFIMEYKICNVFVSDKTNDLNATAVNKWLGVDLGKSVKGLTGYGSNVVLMFNINPTAEEIDLGFYMAPDSPVSRDDFPQKVIKHKAIPADMLKAIGYDNETTYKDDVQEKDAVCVRWVAENGDIRLYLKKACETKYTLYYTVEDVDTTGYAALCCTGYTFLELDDFSVSNISSVYVCADNYVPETRVEIEKEIIYDKGNVDVNGQKESELNSNGFAGCNSQINLAYCVFPITVLGAALLLNSKKGRDEQ